MSDYGHVHSHLHRPPGGAYCGGFQWRRATAAPTVWYWNLEASGVEAGTGFHPRLFNLALGRWPTQARFWLEWDGRGGPAVKNRVRAGRFASGAETRLNFRPLKGTNEFVPFPILLELKRFRSQRRQGAFPGSDAQVGMLRLRGIVLRIIPLRSA